ncbi:MAG: murein L,D-transpeptidase [Alphaproteobacteria bacterium]|nr:murein L,D-transpeptidase [Alphaproteobacteria bacterium]
MKKQNTLLTTLTLTTLSIFYILLITSCSPMHSCIKKLHTIRAKLLPTVNQKIIEAQLKPGAPGFIRIFKEEAILEFWLFNSNSNKYQLYKTYPVCNYSGTLGSKLREGDMQSPEGFYDIIEDRLWPGSKYNLAMNIGFPNAYDKAHKRTGTNLMIHGGCESEGCYAMTDRGIEEIYLLVEQSLSNGQHSIPVHIFPFHMNNKNIKRHKLKGWLPFWLSLKKGYEIFEHTHIPPHVSVENDRYIFQKQSNIHKGKI